MTEDDLQAWLERYVEAWRSYDPKLIGDLFTDDASYAYHPWDVGDAVVRGREAIVASWLNDPDQPDSWSAGYSPLMIADDRAVVTGTTSYTNGDVFHNLWVLRFVGDRCATFVEWYMTAPPSASLD